MLALMAFGYLLLHDLLGGTLLSHSAWDSYTLQAMAWRRGSLSLGRNYPWLELAVYQGEYYVSFPPFPSVVLLPFTFLFGENTPNNLIIAIVTMATAALPLRLIRERRLSTWRSEAKNTSGHDSIGQFRHLLIFAVAKPHDVITFVPIRRSCGWSGNVMGHNPSVGEGHIWVKRLSRRHWEQGCCGNQEEQGVILGSR